MDLVSLWHEMSSLEVVGLCLFSIGGVLGVYIGFRASGWKSVLPWHTRGQLARYSNMTKTKQAPRWPIILRPTLQLGGEVMWFAGLATRLSHSVKPQ